MYGQGKWVKGGIMKNIGSGQITITDLTDGNLKVELISFIKVSPFEEVI